MFFGSFVFVVFLLIMLSFFSNQEILDFREFSGCMIIFSFFVSVFLNCCFIVVVFCSLVEVDLMGVSRLVN